MKFAVAVDSFKGCLSSKEVCEAAERGLRSAGAEDVIKIPLADGGEGSAETIVEALGGKLIESQVINPFGDIEEGYYGYVDSQNLGVIDTAAASGIQFIKNNEHSIMNASTYGTGIQIMQLIDIGCKNIIVGLGGSGTNDGGIGAFYALGGILLDENGNELDGKKGASVLSKIKTISCDKLDKRLKNINLKLMYDVSIPLTGRKGCSLNYSPQKGATSKQVKLLEAGMKNYKNSIINSLHINPDEIPGAGAAGGLGCGLYLAGGIPVAGANYILELVEFERKVKNCSIVITGEGKCDFQTSSGKLPSAIAVKSKKYGKTVICICGVSAPNDKLYEIGVDGVFSISDKPMSPSYSYNNASSLIEKLCYNLGKTLIALKDSFN